MNFPQQQTATYINDYSFMAKVFFYFGLAVLISAGGVYTGFTYLLETFLENPALMWVAFAVELLLVFTARAWSAMRPLNVLLFGLFAFSTGLTLVPLLLSFSLEFGLGIIVKALLATTCMFGATALIGYTTKRNLSGFGGFLFMALIGMIIISVIGIFVQWSNTFEMIFAGFGVILFGGYTMYDIQQLKLNSGLNPIEGALKLYLDIFNLFIFILRLMGGFSRD